MIFEENRRAMTWLIVGASLTTLFFWSNLNDPFNAPKSWILSISGFWLLGWLCFQVKAQIKLQPLKWATILSGIYLLTLFVAFCATDQKYIGLFGDYQRRTGLLSYLCLISFFLAASYLVDLRGITLFENAILVVGFITGLYGFAQHFNVDFVKWANPYNSVIDTLGNPDFAAALMAIFLILNFGIAIQKKYVTWARLTAGLNSLLLLAVITFSQARQGLLVSAFGVAVVILVVLHQRSQALAKAATGVFGVIIVFGIIGILNQGPLAKYLYKPSVSFRGYYWRAGIQMFIHHPIFGVGLDRYGANYRQYREAAQIAKTGATTISNAAHNVPIQLAATGGIFVLLGFLALTGFIFYRGVVALRRTSGAQQITVASIFAAWLAYQGQSLVSIDNLGIAVWGYVLGGVITGISLGLRDPKIVPEKRSLIQPLISTGLVLFMFAVSVLFFESESAAKSLHTTGISRNQSDRAAYEEAVQKPLTFIFQEPTFELTAASNLARVGDFDLAQSRLSRILKADPKNFAALDLQARLYEFQNKWGAAAAIRSEMVSMDPFDTSLRTPLSVDRQRAGLK